MNFHFNQFVFNCFQSFVLGIIQGFTEFLPISSTAHLKVIPYVIGWEDPGVSVSASLQLGSAIAIVFFFKEDLILISNSFFSIFYHRKPFKDKNSRLATFIFLGSIPILIIGLIVKLFWPDFSDSNLRSLFSISIVSLVMALLLFISEIYGKRNKFLNDINIIDILFIGTSQVFAIIPGVSRSGITLTSSLFAGIDRQTAARLSFLVGIPAISISGLIELISILKNTTLIGIFPIILGITSSYFSSRLAIGFFLKFLKNNNTFIFVLYRLFFGLFIFLSL